MIRSLLGFLPWIAYAVLATSDNWRYGAMVGLAIALVLVVLDRRSGKQWDQMVIECSAVVFLTLAIVISLAAPGASFMRYGPALVDGWLALTAWGSLAIRKPFTLGIARSMAPREVWETPVFYRINAVITSVWGTAFVVAGVALAVLLYSAPHATAAVIAVKVIGFAAPAVFTARYPKIVAARYA
ncbi:DUF3159 domain-containing protein [Sphaerisporangium corydalis]|uniref:DUF3159 domain-containing protein n=1 Tax=Sphaerisporangium corydalis TaxID=1441875 RepID=A0ABV9EUF1_9ACTN|nr:hypothetical protein [Sphaerisporangium corydalis]